ncbi:MAG: hypothetical protein IPO36_19225 [Anaerolineales bacterium]|nr:hypothetical protein [Anaerolineales bacterium]
MKKRSSPFCCWLSSCWLSSAWLPLLLWPGDAAITAIPDFSRRRRCGRGLGRQRMALAPEHPRLVTGISRSAYA